MEKIKTILLSSGFKMPSMGFGTYQITNVDAVYIALKTGYRLIDTASIYENSELVKPAIERAFSEGLLERKDLFVTSKLWCKEYEDPIGACKKELSALGLDYLDLYLIHWPEPLKVGEKHQFTVPRHFIWAEMEKLVEMGLVRSLGVSNYSCQSLIDLLSYAKIKPSVNQIEVTPLLQQTNLVAFCQDQNIQITAFNSLLQRYYKKDQKEELNLLDHPIIQVIAEKHDASESDVLLAWALKRNIAVIPKSNTVERIEANFKATRLKLTEKDMNAIKTIDCGIRCTKKLEFPIFD